MESRTAVDYYELTLALADPEERWDVRPARDRQGSLRWGDKAEAERRLQRSREAEATGPK
jgi:hypothetical protein